MRTASTQKVTSHYRPTLCLSVHVSHLLPREKMCWSKNRQAGQVGILETLETLVMSNMNTGTNIFVNKVGQPIVKLKLFWAIIEIPTTTLNNNKTQLYAGTEAP